MGSRHHSLDYSEVKDVTQLVQDFQELNGVHVRMELEVVQFGRGPQLQVTAEAWESRHPSTGAPLLASASVGCSATNLKHLRDVVTHVLYMLDGRLAEAEMGGNRGP